MERIETRPGPAARRPAPWRRMLVAVLIVMIGGGVALGDDLQDRYSRARFKEKTEQQPEQALTMYQELLDEPALGPDLRGGCLLGMARCHLALGEVRRAETIWEEVATDATLPASVREAAERARNQHVARSGGIDEEALRDQVLRREDERLREQASALLQQARLALAEGRFDHAHRLCIDALAKDPDNTEARLLLDQVLRAMPDRGELLKLLLDFVHTTRIQAFQRLKSDVYDLEREGRRLFKAEEYAWADERFRRAIELIDQSEFLVDMADERAALLRWLQLTIEEGRKAGLELADVPPLPDPGQMTPGFRRRFFDLLSELFTRGPDEENPLEIHDLKGAPKADVETRATLLPGPFPDGILVQRETGSLDRATWAEGWIRARVGTGWPEDGSSTSGAPRILKRFGDLLIVQHTPQIQRQVREVVQSFADVPPPMVVDVAILAADGPGGTRLASRLGVRPEPRDEGYATTIDGRLIEECLADVTPLEGVDVLGTARLVLAGTSTSTIAVDARSDAHPLYQGLPAPPLQLSASESLYGLDLELFAEDLPEAPGRRRAALSVRASTRRPVGTVVVPKGGQPGAWSRIAKPMLHHAVAADRAVEHVATLLVTGLANPFPDPEGTRPDLIVLIGVRPGVAGSTQAPVPDPPRGGEGEAPGVGEQREYALGALSFEVEDAVVIEGWPQRPASLPVLPATARAAREDYLEERLGVGWTQLVTPGEPSPVEVVGEVARARLDPGRHARLKQAVEALREQEGVLYEVDVVAVETGEEQLAEWLRLASAQSFTPGTYLAQVPEGHEALDVRMRAQEPTGSLYTTRSRLPVRATQRVAVRRLQTETIVEHVRISRAADGSTRYSPVPGVAEEGLLVLVRPELDVEGRRMVIVDARAARLEAIESLLLPGIEQRAARVQVPRHFPVQQRRAAVPMTDDQALLLTLPVPGGAGRVIVVKVTVRRVQ